MFKLGDRVRIIRSEWRDDTADLNQEGIISAVLSDDHIYNYEVDFGCTIVNNAGHYMTHTGVSDEEHRERHYRFYNKDQLELIVFDDIGDITADEIAFLLS